MLRASLLVNLAIITSKNLRSFERKEGVDIKYCPSAATDMGHPTTKYGFPSYALQTSNEVVEPVSFVN
jgi:hypothetical protein